MKKALVWSLICLGFSVAAQSTRSVTLSESIELALENSATVRKSKLDRQALELRLKEGRGAMYPQINATLGMEYYPILPTQVLPGELFGQPGAYVPLQIGRPWQMGAGIVMEQQLMNESMRRAVPAMNTTRAIYELLTQKTEEELIFTTATIYYQTLQTEQLLSAINANLGKLEAWERMAQLQLANGYAIPTDVKRIKVARTNMETQRQNLYTAISSLKQTLKFLCGVPFEAPFDPYEALENPLSDSLRWQNIHLETEATTDHRLLLRHIELNRTQIYSNKALNFPSLGSYISAQAQTFRADANFVDPGSRWYGLAVIGVKLKVPVFDGFRRFRKANLLRLDGVKLEEDLRQLTQAKNLEFLQAREQLKNAQRAVSTQTDNVTLAREICDKLTLQYREGVVPLTDLLNAQTALSEADTNFWQQVFAYKLAYLKLLKTAGQLEGLR